jgi:hypothetical protein
MACNICETNFQGTKRTFRDVCFAVAIGGKADHICS